MKHKHADLIHAWADGAEIQLFHIDRWEDCPSPAWRDAVTYRVKPEKKKPVVRWLWANDMNIVSSQLHSEEEIKLINKSCPVGFGTKLEWSRTEFPE